MDESKPWWASKTIWASVIGGGAMVASAFGFTVLDDPATQAQAVGIIMAVAGIVLRLITKDPVK